MLGPVTQDGPQPATLELRETSDALCFAFGGRWSLQESVPAQAPLIAKLDAAGKRSVHFDLQAVTAFDSALVSAVFRIWNEAERRGLEVVPEGLPESLRQLVQLARAVPPRKAKVEAVREGFFTRLGQWGLRGWASLVRFCEFVGEITLSAVRLLRGKSQLRWKEFWLITQSVSYEALPIVALISFLIGLIIAFVGSVVLRQFGAEFAIAYLIGDGMFREMGAVMTGIIMAGRTGAAFAAQIGSMKVNEEVDALKTYGISPIDFLVLPRILATGIMMPLLTVFANVVGVMGGFLVARFLMEVPTPMFFRELNRVVSMEDFWLGMTKAFAFGLIVAGAGCLRGLQAERGAAAVGQAATRAVVTAITLIILANALIDWAAATLRV